MESREFREASAAMTDLITNYLDNIRDRRVLPEISPGYLRPLIPDTAPDKPETWKDVFNDIERVIMPGVTHWHSPQFHAYFPTANSYPAILADMLTGAIGCIGFTWIASPACTELEVVMMDWLGKLIGLPDPFLACSDGTGGGVIQGTASEATLVALLSARARTVKAELAKNPNQDENNIRARLVVYGSDQAHSSVERAGMLASVRMRLLKTDDNYSLRGETLQKAINEDKAKGFIPCYVVGTLGATPSCSFDNLEELGQVAKKEGIWLHVDAAYAGSALVCEEFRWMLKGVENACSFNFNPHKWLLVNFDCSAMWFKNANEVVDAFNVDPLYLKHESQGKAPDYRHWQIPLGRRFRSLKLWFVMRIYGKEGLQAHIRKQVALAHEFEEYVKGDSRYEIIAPVQLGLVCFRLKGENDPNEKMLNAINHGGIIHLVPAKIKEVYFLRFAVCSRYTESSDVKKAWDEIKKQEKIILNQK